MVEFYNVDCVEFLKTLPDKHFDLAIVDPPYGLGDRIVRGGSRNVMKKFEKSYKEKRWDVVPSPEYFKELFRVSKNQIIFGGNYFTLPPTRGIICWDKKVLLPTFSRWEYAWTSFDKVAKMIETPSNKTQGWHPTEKPIYVYKFLLENYAKPGDKILDTHGGTGGIAIACHDYGYDLTICEIDPEYFGKLKKRYETHLLSPKMFKPEEIRNAPSELFDKEENGNEI
jgi:site-specific DNA-methyltransferase (adenine-specific)